LTEKWGEEMDAQTKAKLIRNATDWFRDELATAHIENVKKLKDLKEFKVNPFTWKYLANFIDGQSDYTSLAKALILPRALGTSISTSFGTRAQEFITRIFDGVLGSQVAGMDLEFTDQIDGRKKYCQVKSGPQVINSGDVAEIKGKFKTASNLARANHLDVRVGDYVFGLLYGDQSELSAFIKDIQTDYTTYVGQEFWHHITGDAGFYETLTEAIGKVAEEFDGRQVLEETIHRLALDIEKHANQ
jgi:hypothetical protein